MQTSAYLTKKPESVPLSSKPSYERFNKRKLIYDHLRTWQCLCFYRKVIDKLETAARPAVFIGYGTTNDHYKAYDLNTEEILVVRDIIFDKDTPGSTLFSYKITDYKPFFYIYKSMGSNNTLVKSRSIRNFTSFTSSAYFSKQ